LEPVKELSSAVVQERESAHLLAAEKEHSLAARSAQAVEQLSAMKMPSDVIVGNASVHMLAVTTVGTTNSNHVIKETASPARRFLFGQSFAWMSDLPSAEIPNRLHCVR